MGGDAIAFRIVGIALDLLRRSDQIRAGQTLDGVIGEGLGSGELGKGGEIAGQIIGVVEFQEGIAGRRRPMREAGEPPRLRLEGEIGFEPVGEASSRNRGAVKAAYLWGRTSSADGKRP